MIISSFLRNSFFFAFSSSFLRISFSPELKDLPTNKHIKMATPTVKLNSGYDMPIVGFGLWKVTNETCADQVYNAIKTGYRCFDGACGMW